jgi:hypothetical protein
MLAALERKSLAGSIARAKDKSSVSSRQGLFINLKDLG